MVEAEFANGYDLSIGHFPGRKKPIIRLGKNGSYIAHAVFKGENAKLRETLKGLMMGTNDELCADRGESDCKECSMHHDEDGCIVVDAMEMLGIDVYGEPLGIEVER